MRLSVSAGFKSYLLTKMAKTFARCWKVTLKTGAILGFTTHTRDIILSNVTYTTISGLTTSSTKSSEGFSVDNLAISAFLAAQDELDILRGRYDGAMVEVFVVNYFNLGLGTLTEKVGFLGEITRADGVFQAEVRGLMDMLRTKIGRVYTAACDARLGDARCKFPLTAFGATITAVTGLKSFQAAAIAGTPNGWYTVGYVEFTSGNNVGIQRDIRFQSGINFDLFLSTPFPLVVGDSVSLFIGCDKTKPTCINKFNNLVNFRGFDFVPVIEQVFDSPVTLSPNLTVCAQADPGYVDTGVVPPDIVPSDTPPPSDTGSESDSGC